MNKFLLSMMSILIVVLVLLLPYKLALVFEYENNGNEIAYIPFSNPDTFKLKYTHSIHLSNVIESYRTGINYEIIQYELMYEDFAVGMPANSEEGEYFEEYDGKYFIKNMNRQFPSIYLRVGKVRANHTLIYKEKQIPLNKIMSPGTLVHIQVRRINLIQMLKGVEIVNAK